jgi:hypothetical protein
MRAEIWTTRERVLVFCTTSPVAFYSDLKSNIYKREALSMWVARTVQPESTTPPLWVRKVGKHFLRPQITPQTDNRTDHPIPKC